VNKLLVDEPTRIILPQLAVKIGLNEAIVLQQVHFWIQGYAKKRDKKHFHDGRYWVYNTYGGWQKDNFPFWCERTIRRAIDSLRKPYKPKVGEKKVERGPLLLVGNYNRKGYDKTLWYSIDYDEVYKVENNDDLSKSEWPKWTDGCGPNGQMDVAQMDTPIPENTRDHSDIETDGDLETFLKRFSHSE
jgi:hypothetical protein